MTEDFVPWFTDWNHGFIDIIRFFQGNIVEDWVFMATDRIFAAMKVFWLNRESVSNSGGKRGKIISTFPFFVRVRYF